jgi:hypothetical protein
LGADIYLRSVATDAVQEAVCQSLMPPGGTIIAPAEVISALNQYYERLAETGGYFRDPYNESGLLPALGMDWGRDVSPLLDSARTLPIAGARHLLVEIEQRPITPAMVEEILAGRGTPHPMVAFMRRIREEFGDDLHIAGLVEKTRPDEPLRPGQFDAQGFMRHLIKRRARLMRLLRRSIEQNEPLLCNL